MNIAQGLKELLESKNMSRSKLAREIGVHTSTVSNWLAGKDVKAENLSVLCEYFDCSLDFLAGNIKEKPPANQADHERSNENDFFISEDIKTIIFCFNQLNAQGKAELIKYAQNLTYIPQYKKLPDADEEVG